MSAAAHGLLVLGMHRSGTSALARVLNLGGADIGARLLGASAGNERGHWEDAFAVELHERLLANFGVRWSDPFSLPPDWQTHSAAQAARRSIASYLLDDRGKHPLWAVKDPRLSLFADLWLDAAAGIGMPVSAIVLLRHPMQVAHSLEARDGIAPGQALLLWMNYTLSAIHSATKVPSILLSQGQLLSDWKACLSMIAMLPGAKRLQLGADVQRQVDKFLDRSMHHHSADQNQGLPVPVADLWRLLEGFLAPAALPPDKIALELERAGAIGELIQPLLLELRTEQRALWQRVSRAEGMLSPTIEAVVRLPAEIEELRERADVHHQNVILAISDEVRTMQLAQVAAIESAATAQADANASRVLGPTITALADAITSNRQALVDAISIELRRMQDVTSAALRSVELSGVQVEQWRKRHADAVLQIDALRSSEAEWHKRHATGLLEINALRASEGSWRSRHDALASELENLRSEYTSARTQLESALDENKRENSGLRAEILRLRDLADQLEQIRGSHSWRLTRPLRLLRRLLSGNWSASDSSRLSRGILSVAARTPLLPAGVNARVLRALASNSHDPVPLAHALSPAIGLEMQQEGVADVFVWSVIDWHFRTQRPQHLARALAGKGHRVFYISNNFVDKPEAGFSVSPLDDDGRLFQLHLHLADTPSIYAGMPDDARIDAMLASLAEVLCWSGTRSSLSFVQHPYWTQIARSVPNARLVYDCMDHHPGFENNATSILRAEDALVGGSDLVVVTSSWLETEMQGRARQVSVVRNAADYEFFRCRPAQIFQDAEGRRIVGYYGAIAEWFDVELVREVAQRCPDALLVLVGADTVGARERLSDVPNVRFIGEVPYRDLPYWLHAFDVCMLPFQVVALTLATNPVKVYEYLSAGKPVVVVDLPEMTQFSGLVEIAANAEDFVAAVKHLLERDQTREAVADRQSFASGQTWAHRAAALDAAVGAIEEPRVSVVVLTYNNLEFTRACLFSIEAYSDYDNLQIIVVDNASSDGSGEWLREWQSQPSQAGHERTLILNTENMGFAAGNNVGLRAANGEFLIILNNDTYVTPGWVRTLCAHLRRDPSLGLVGPVTNNIGNEAKLELQYSSMEQMIALAAEHARANPGGEVPLATAAFFCVAMTRGIFDDVGELDEAYGIGFFEDDDYCRRVEQAGFRIACAEDVFVHHHLSASFEKMQSEQKRALFEKNKKTYEAKWGAWLPHAYRNTKGSS